MGSLAIGYRRSGSKNERWGYRAEKEVGYLQPSGYLHERDGQTDGRTDEHRTTVKTRLRTESHGNKTEVF